MTFTMAPPVPAARKRRTADGESHKAPAAASPENKKGKEVYALLATSNL
jgi:hypothetical protein